MDQLVAGGHAGPEDDVLIRTGTVTLSDAVAVRSLSVTTTGTLIFSGWFSRLTATNDISISGTISLPAAFTNNGVSNRVWFAGGGFALESTGRMTLDGKGFQGGPSAAYGSGQGPGGPANDSNTGGGGGHGAAGAGGYSSPGGPACGTLEAPELPGSGGAGNYGYSGAGGAGGGAVRIDATTGAVRIDGTISANGVVGSNTRGGGGSGGSIWIAARTFAGNGLLRANGANGTAGVTGGGGGGGGRIAVTTDSVAQSLVEKPMAAFQVKRGDGGRPADVGTLYVTDLATLNTDPYLHSGVLFDSAATTAWSVARLTISNGWLRLPKTAFKLTVEENLSLMGTATSYLQFTSSALMADSNRTELTVGGDVILTNAAYLYLQSLATNGIAGKPDHGLLATVGGDLVIASSCWIQAQSESYGGGSPMIRVGRLLVQAGGGIDANSRGFRRGIGGSGYGPGRGIAATANGSGAGYGGRGGRSLGTASRGVTYGDPQAPVFPGSGGGGRTGYATADGGNGGGLIRVEAQGEVVLDGTLTANGADGGTEGGGSGGGVFIKCRRFAGAATGRLLAQGGDGYTTDDGAGGGGRIAVWYGKWNMGVVTPERLADQGTNKPAGFAGTAGVTPGTISYSTDPESGTVRFIQVLSSPPGTVILIR